LFRVKAQVVGFFDDYPKRWPLRFRKWLDFIIFTGMARDLLLFL